MRFFRLRKISKELALANGLGEPAPPVRLGEYLYYERLQEGQNFSVHLRQKTVKDSVDGRMPEEVVLDPNAEGAGHEVIGIGSWALSPDGQRVAFLKDTRGDEQYSLEVRQIVDQQPVATVAALDGHVKSMEWDRSGRYLFVATTLPGDSLRAGQCWRLDVSTGEKALIYEEADSTFALLVGSTKMKDFIRLTAVSYSSCEHWMIPTDAPTLDPFLIRPRRLDVMYFVDYLPSQQSWIIFSDNAFFLSDASLKNWKLMYAANPEIAVSEIDCFETFCVATGYKQGQPWMKTVFFEQTASILAAPESHRSVTEERNFPRETSIGLCPSFDVGAKKLKLKLSSPIQPPYYVSYFPSERRLEGLSERNGTHEISTLITPEDDIPITLIRPRKDALGSTPLLLNVYGAYGSISEAGEHPKKFFFFCVNFFIFHLI
jgi:protease II